MNAALVFSPAFETSAWKRQQRAEKSAHSPDRPLLVDRPCKLA
jgi:hypothetical protein